MTRLLPQKGLRYNPAIRRFMPYKGCEDTSWHIITEMKEDPKGKYVRYDEIEFVNQNQKGENKIRLTEMDETPRPGAKRYGGIPHCH